MKTIVEKVRREPAIVVGIVGALISLLLAFGLELTVQQQGAIMGAVVAALALVTRQAVTPNVSVGALTDNQENPGGRELMAGQASDVPTGDPVDVTARDDHP